MFPKSKELLSPSLSMFPKTNHVGNPHVRCSAKPLRGEAKHLRKGWEERLSQAEHNPLVQILQGKEHTMPCWEVFCLEDVPTGPSLGSVRIWSTAREIP